MTLSFLKKVIFITVIAAIVLFYVISINKESKLMKYLKVNMLNKASEGNEYITIVSPTVRKHSFLQGFLQCSTRRLKIYLHYRGDYISDNIIASERWEAGMVSQFEQYIKAHPGIQVMDVGCNLGVYTLAAAALGCRVVAIDANPSNTDRLMQSLLVNELKKSVTICLNAMSNDRNNLIIKENPTNIGGSRVHEAKNDSKSVKAIYMDDLIPFFDKDKEVAIKIDIEGKEIDVFKQASKFFKGIKINFVMMEWIIIKDMNGVKDILDFFTTRKFTPYNNCVKNVKLNVEKYLQWPMDMCWLK